MGIKKPVDMNPADIIGEYATQTIALYEVGERNICVTDVETPFPEGKLIVSVADLYGNITEANKAFVDMSAWQREELMGQGHCILRHPDMPKACYADIWATLQRGEKWRGYVKNLRKDGGYYWTYTTILPNYRKGELVGYSSVRRKPSRSKIAEHISLYKEMKNAEV